jgi:hypothetical protein
MRPAVPPGQGTEQQRDPVLAGQVEPARVLRVVGEGLRDLESASSRFSSRRAQKVRAMPYDSGSSCDARSPYSASSSSVSSIAARWPR